MKKSFTFAPLAVVAALAVGGCSMKNPGMLCDGIFASQIEACRGHDIFYQYKPGESNFYAARAKCEQFARGAGDNIIAQARARSDEIERQNRQEELERQRLHQQHEQNQALIGAIGALGNNQNSGNRRGFEKITTRRIGPSPYIPSGGGSSSQDNITAGFAAMAARQEAMISCLAELGWLRCTQGGQNRPECRR